MRLTPISLPLMRAPRALLAVSNGTKRIAVAVGLAAAIWRVQRAGAIPSVSTLKLVLAFVLSALSGSLLASVLPMASIRLLVPIALMVALDLVQCHTADERNHVNLQSGAPPPLTDLR